MLKAARAQRVAQVEIRHRIQDEKKEARPAEIARKNQENTTKKRKMKQRRLREKLKRNEKRKIMQKGRKLKIKLKNHNKLR